MSYRFARLTKLASVLVAMVLCSTFWLSPALAGGGGFELRPGDIMWQATAYAEQTKVYSTIVVRAAANPGLHMTTRGMSPIPRTAVTTPLYAFFADDMPPTTVLEQRDNELRGAVSHFRAAGATFALQWNPDVCPVIHVQGWMHRTQEEDTVGVSVASNVEGLYYSFPGAQGWYPLQSGWNGMAMTEAQTGQISVHMGKSYGAPECATVTWHKTPRT